MKLLIVESPTKANTIEKILKTFEGEWKVIATKGHILNLPQHELGIEFKDNTITPKWVYEKGKKKTVDYIKNLASKADEVFIATDDDREGEKIAADIAQKANLKNYKRVTFLEITKSEILRKIKQGREIDKNIVNAAIARRLIDRYIGYPISTIIKHDFQKNKSSYKPRGVGRVISPSLHILVDLEEKIETFVAEPHQKVLITYVKNGIQVRTTSLVTFPPEAKKELDEFLYKVKTSKHIVEYYKQKTEDREPPKPLITSTLQYGAWYLFRIKPKKTMKIAQELFEKGFITYHRTDSYRISKEAHEKMVSFLYNKYGDEYVVSTQRQYEKKENAQNAHEAIRPTHFEENYTPENINKIDNSLTKEHLQIYEFIWYRTIITQIKAAVYDVSVVEINAGGNIFKAQANHRLFDGWERFKGNLIKASVRDENDDWKDRDIEIPEFTIGEALNPLSIQVYDTIPHRPKRYGVGRFVGILFRNGIARPSTLDSIVDNLENKEYITIKKGMLYPTPLGIKVDEWLEENVNWLIDIELAKNFEKQLDEVEQGKMSYIELIKEYVSYVKELEKRFNIEAIERTKPTPSQIMLIKKIAKEKKIKLNDNILNNKKLAEAFIDAHYKESIIGKCPVCKKSNVFEYEKVFACGSRECGFKIFKKQIEAFFEKFGLPGNEKLIKEFLKVLLRDKKVYMKNLKSSKGNKFDAFIQIKKDKGYFNFEFSFPKKEVQEKYINAYKEIYKNAGIDLEKVELMEKVKELEEERRLLKEAHLKDGLTRAYNRKALEEDIIKLNQYKEQLNLHIAFIDADKFKRVNDTYGHKKGDKVLKTIVNHIFQAFREQNVKGRLYRYGGEEFLIIVRDMNDNEFFNFLENIRKKMENHIYNHEGEEFRVTTSIGYVDSKEYLNSKTIEEVIEKADKAVYKAKEAGRNRIVLYSSQ